MRPGKYPQGGNEAPSQGPSQTGAGQGSGQGSDQNLQEPSQESQPPPVEQTSPSNTDTDTDTTIQPAPEKAPDSTNSIDEDSDLCVRKRCIDRIDRPLDYGVAQSNGDRVLNEIRDFSAGNLPKRPVPDTANGYIFQRDGEDVTETPESPVDLELGHGNIFADPTAPDLNLDITSRVSDVGWRSIAAPPLKNGFENTDINRAKIDTRQGVMIASTRDKTADGNVLAADGSTNRDNAVPSHELSWQLWQRQVSEDGGDISNLRVLVAESVQGKGTKDTITTAIGKLQSTKTVQGLMSQSFDGPKRRHGHSW